MTADSDANVDRTALDERIRRSWEELQAAVGSLDDGQLTAPGPDGWSVKDHLAHLAAWEGYLASAMDGRDGPEGLGLPADHDRNEEAINAALHARDAGRSADEVRRSMTDAHAAVVTRLRTLDQAELERSIRSIEGNTWQHYDEHRGWIAELLASQSV